MANVENIPIARLKWLNRPAERRKMPADHFLDEEKKLFPVKNENGTYNCYLIRAALVRAAALHRRDVEEKARKLYYSICSKNKEKKMSERFYYSDLATKLPQIKENTLLVNILPFGEFVDPDYGYVKFDHEYAEKIVNNFKNNAPTYNPPLVDKEHMTDGSYGEIKDMEIKDDGLYAIIEFSEDAFEEIKNGKFKYMSPVIDENYLDKNTGEVIGPTIKGVALTNMPRIPGMLPLQLFSDVRSKTFAEKIKSLFGQDEDDIISEEEAKLLNFNDCCKGDDDVSKEELERLRKENEELKEQVQKLYSENVEHKIKEWSENWKNQGVAPAVVDAAVEAIKKMPKMFSDNSVMDLMEGIFKAVPKVDMKQYSENTVTNELSPEEIAKNDVQNFYKE